MLSFLIFRRFFLYADAADAMPYCHADTFDFIAATSLPFDAACPPDPISPPFAIAARRRQRAKSAACEAMRGACAA